VKDGQSVEKEYEFKWDPYNGLSFLNSLVKLLEELEQVNHSWLKLMSKLFPRKVISEG
jgi:hypothetical protein